MHEFIDSTTIFPVISYPVIVLSAVYFLVAAVSVFDVRTTQARMGILKSTVAEDLCEVSLPDWIAFLHVVDWFLFIALLILNWPWAIAFRAVLFVLKVLPVLESVGALLVSPFLKGDSSDDNQELEFHSPSYEAPGAYGIETDDVGSDARSSSPGVHRETAVVRVLVGDLGDAVAELILDGLSEELSEGTVIDTVVSPDPDQLVKEAGLRDFDLAFIVANNLICPRTRETDDRVRASINLVRTLHYGYGLQVMVVYGFPDDPGFASQYVDNGANFAAKIPCEWADLASAFRQCLGMQD